MTTGFEGQTPEDSMDTATNFFERMLDSADGTTSHDDEDDVENADSDELEADQEDEDESDESEEQSDEDDEDEDSESDDEGETLSERELNRKVPVTIDGQTEYRTVRELMADHMRQSDYTRKTQEIAAEKQKLQAQAAELESVNQERAYYRQMLEAHQQKLVQEFQPLTNEQWQYLRENDPLEYSIRRQDLQDRKEAFAQAEREKAVLAQRMAHDQQQQLQTTVSSEFQKLYSVHPEWQDQKVWTRVKSEILEYGESIGYSKEELKQATDSRAILALHKAMVAEKVRTAKPARPSEVKAAPKTMPTSSVNARVPRAKSEVAKAQQRLAKSGSVDDAADAFLKGGFV